CKTCFDFDQSGAVAWPRSGLSSGPLPADSPPCTAGVLPAVSFLYTLATYSVIESTRRFTVKRYLVVLIVLLCGAVYAQRGPGGGAGQPAGGAAPGQGQPGGGGRGRGNPEQAAAAAAQNQLEQSTPQIPFEAVSLPLMPEGHTIGETE